MAQLGMAQPVRKPRPPVCRKAAIIGQRRGSRVLISRIPSNVSLMHFAALLGGAVLPAVFG